jgi:hypothetical protein
LEALNNLSLIDHELIATDVAFGVSFRVAAVMGRPGGFLCDKYVVLVDQIKHTLSAYP